MNFAKIFFISSLLLWCGRVSAYSAQIIFIDSVKASGIEYEQLNFVSQYLGISIKEIVVNHQNKQAVIKEKNGENAFDGVVVTARSLKYINNKTILDVSKKIRGGIKSLLIVGITSDFGKSYLYNWSKNPIICLDSQDKLATNSYFKIAENEIARELSGQLIPFQINNTMYTLDLEVCNIKNLNSIISLVDIEMKTQYSIFASHLVQGINIYYVTRIGDSYNYSNHNKWKYSTEHFLEIAPLIMYIKAVCGEACWHRPKRQANLTIDDPWLREEYGFLNYGALLDEMKINNFHTTIAFIPWNFNRNQHKVINLFLENSKYYSICIHGNNHNHREFSKRDKKNSENAIHKKYQEQEKDIVQALARMEKFKEITKINYDKVMVFPHGIATERTLNLLKKHNFLATANSRSFSFGTILPDSQLYELRSYNTYVNNFLSMRRIVPINEKTINLKYKIAIDLFLGNPIIFYTHHAYFKNGIDNFNLSAQIVNNIHPEVEWGSLKKIVQYSYLMRKKENGNIEIYSFSNDFILENNEHETITYCINKKESDKQQINKITIDDVQNNNYEVVNDIIFLKLEVPPNSKKRINIEYINNIDLADVDISKVEINANLLRNLSDFRDIILSKNMLIYSFVELYYQENTCKIGFIIVLIVLLILIISSLLLISRLIGKRRQH